MANRATKEAAGAALARLATSCSSLARVRPRVGRRVGQTKNFAQRSATLRSVRRPPHRPGFALLAGHTPRSAEPTMSAASSPRLGPTDAPTTPAASAATSCRRRRAAADLRGRSVARRVDPRGRFRPCAAGRSRTAARRRSRRRSSGCSRASGGWLREHVGRAHIPPLLHHRRLRGYALHIVVLSFLVALLTSRSRCPAIATCGTSAQAGGPTRCCARARQGDRHRHRPHLLPRHRLPRRARVPRRVRGALPRRLDLQAIGAHLWGLIFMTALSLFVGGGIKIVAKLGLAFFAVVIATLLLLYVSSSIARPHDQPACVPEANYSYVPSGSGSGSYAYAAGSLDGAGPHHHGVRAPTPAMPRAPYWRRARPRAPAAVTNVRSVLGLEAAGRRIARQRRLICGDRPLGRQLCQQLGPRVHRGRWAFAQCLGIFFPCFTGILSGANRASALRDPVTAHPARHARRHLLLVRDVLDALPPCWSGVGSAPTCMQPYGHIGAAHDHSTRARWCRCALRHHPLVARRQALQCLVVAPRLLASIAASASSACSSRSPCSPRGSRSARSL